VAQSNHENSEDTIQTYSQENLAKQQNFSQKVQPQIPWPQVGCALFLLSPTLMTDNKPTFVLDQTHRFVGNLLLSQPLRSDVDVKIYVFLWASSHSHFAICHKLQVTSKRAKCTF